MKKLSDYVSSYDNDKKVDHDKTTRWKVTSEGERGYIIVRYVRFKNDSRVVKERLDRELYQHQKDNKTKCEEICRILNHRNESRLKAREAWIIKSSFIKVQGGELSRKFEDYMRARSSNDLHARKCRRMVETHFLNYFYHERGEPLYDYLDWVSLKTQAEYIEYLLNKKVKASRNKKIESTLSAKTIRSIIQYINHFMRFLHIESDGNIPLLKFTFPSITNARLSDHMYKRNKKLNKAKDDQYIDEETFKIIYSRAGEEIKSAIWLAYNYGLRRSEVLALEVENVKKTHLKITHQLKALDIERENKKKVGINNKILGPLKNRKEEGRKIPHLYSTPQQAYDHILKLNVIHPSGLSEKWSELMKELDMNYTFHNLRNAFTSNALRDCYKFGISPSDVQLALGHSDLRTTMLYLRDYRKLDDDETWSPTG